MDEINKKDLKKRAIFRTAINLGTAAGLSCFKPEFAWAYLMGGYANVMLGMKFTNYRMKEMANWQPQLEPTNLKELREYYLKGPQYIEEPKETYYEQLEGKIIDAIETNTPIIVEKIKHGIQQLKKRQFNIETKKSILKHQQALNENQATNSIN